MDRENKPGKGPKQPSVDVIVFVVPFPFLKHHYSIPIDDKDTVADLTKKIHLISRLDDENFFGLYPIELLSTFRESCRYNDFDKRRISETDYAMRYVDQTLVLLYISK
jgi:hypothetical protein